MEVAVAHSAVAAGAVLGASAVHAPPATVADGAELLDVDVGELAGPFPLVALGVTCRGGPVASIESAESGSPEDRLDRRRRDPHFEGDAVRAPSATLPQADHLPPTRPRNAVR